MYIELTWLWVVFTLIAIWYWIRHESDKAYEEGVQYAIYMHSQGKCTYDLYEDEEGVEVLKIVFKE